MSRYIYSNMPLQDGGPIGDTNLDSELVGTLEKMI